MAAGATSRPNAAFSIFKSMQYYMRVAAPGATFDLVSVNAAALTEPYATVAMEAWRAGARVATYSVAVTSSASVTAQLPDGFAYVDEVRFSASTCEQGYEVCGAWFVLDDFAVRHHAPPL